jgi:prolyl-tRNA synthetase
MMPENNKIMGRYGIGAETPCGLCREQWHDDAGIIWPITIAVPGDADGPRQKGSNGDGQLYEAALPLRGALRPDESAGVKFKDGTCWGSDPC